MTTTLIVPAAGTGTRLRSPWPKVLTPVAGKPMLWHLVDLYRGAVDHAIVVVAPTALDAARECELPSGLEVTFAVQASATGMLDAILVPLETVAARPPDWVWITWCDQVAVARGTVQRLAAACAEAGETGLVVPTSTRMNPYIHFARDAAGRIERVLHRRERDVMPEIGESDIGLFALSRRAYLTDLPAFSREEQRGAATGERNFLPFIPWMDSQRRGAVHTFPCEADIESVGINTPEDLQEIEAHLLSRDTCSRGAARP